MAAGQRFPSEKRTFLDAQTGTEITQLTNYKGHSHPFYFTNSGWWDEGRKLLFGSDRQGRSNLYSLELASGEITQLTDHDQPPPPAETSFLFACKNPRRDEVYYWHGRELIALELSTLEARTLYTAPPRFLTNMLSVTADGHYICTGLYEDLSDRFALDLLHGYVGFHEYWQAKPLSQIVRVATAGSGAEVVFEEHYWIGHVNASPTMPNLLSYCHEGPWDQVDTRIWGLELTTGKTWPIRQTAAGERVGHEYWLADGEHLGYHGQQADGTAFYGSVRFDDRGRLERDFPYPSDHFHSHDLSLIVGDGSRDQPQLLLWRYREDRFEGPRILAYHHSSAHVQATHVHPRLTPDASGVLYASDASGYGNVYLASLPKFETLPEKVG